MVQNKMTHRPTLTTTTAPEILEAIIAIQNHEMRTRASVVQELLAIGLKGRRINLARVGRAHARKSIKTAAV